MSNYPCLADTRDFHQLRSSLNRTVDPTVEPVTVASLKKHARLGDCADEDTLLSSYIKLAREMVEIDTERALTTQTWALKMDKFPSGAIELRRCPVASVTSIVYVDTNGTSTTLSSALYIVNTSTEPGRIVPAYGQSWPDARLQENSITVTFVAGYGATAASVPERACQAIRLLAAEAVISREAVGALSDEQMVNYRAVIDRLRWSGYR